MKRRVYLSIALSILWSIGLLHLCLDKATAHWHRLASGRVHHHHHHHTLPGHHHDNPLSGHDHHSPFEDQHHNSPPGSDDASMDECCQVKAAIRTKPIPKPELIQTTAPFALAANVCSFSKLLIYYGDLGPSQDHWPDLFLQLRRLSLSVIVPTGPPHLILI